MSSNFREHFVFRPFKVSKVEHRNQGTAIPRPRSGHRIVCDGSNLYCFGGYNPSLSADAVSEDDPSWTVNRPLFKELWSYCIATRKWKLHEILEDMPDELASNAMCINGKSIMVFGGTGSPFGNRCSNNLFMYRPSDPGARLRLLNTSGEHPPGQYGQAVICIGHSFYTVGGTNGYAYTSDIFRIDLRTLTWESVYLCTGGDGEPIGRYRHELAYDGKDFYILAGGTGEWAFELVEIPVFNIETKSWSNVTTKMDTTLTPPLGPLPRKCHSAVQIETSNGSQVFVVGGSDGVSVFDEVWRLELRSLQWTLMRKTVLPKPLYFHSSSVTPEGCMYTFGGIEPKEETGRRNNELYKVWLCIPRLSEICWEAILFYNPDLDMMNTPSLLDSGIPIKFVDRLLSQRQSDSKSVTK